MSLIAVSPCDAGSSVDASGNRWAPGFDIDEEALERSLTERGDRYNEWVIRAFEVRAIFVATNPTVAKVTKLLLPPEAAIWIDAPDGILCEEPISFQEIAAALPTLPMYSFDQWGRTTEHRDGDWVAANHSEVVYLWSRP